MAVVGGKCQHAVAIVGGATAGAEAAGILAARGVLCVVFEQNPRPYGKIEDGLPRWHTKLRRKEYDTINTKLSLPGVHFVPLTKIGRDIDLAELVGEWGFSAIVLAHGAWRDRPFPVAGAEDYTGRGFVYQNPFIYWFNHYPERGYSGPRYEPDDGAVVVGGGLASIDVIKVLQIENVCRTLARRGIEVGVLEVEQEGVRAVLAGHGLGWEELGLRGPTLFYRRQVENMPLADAPEGADEVRLRKVAATRRRILEKAMDKYRFQVRTLRAPVGIMTEGDRLVGVRFQGTRVEQGRAVPVPGVFEDVRTPLVVSSIGSVPEPIPGLPAEGSMYRYCDPDLGRIEGYENVFAAGNAVTGKGNILDSRKHSIKVATYLAERFLGLGEQGHEGEEELVEVGDEAARRSAGKVADWVEARRPLEAKQLERLVRRVRERQRAVGYDGSYREWLERVTPPDLA